MYCCYELSELIWVYIALNCIIIDVYDQNAVHCGDWLMFVNAVKKCFIEYWCAIVVALWGCDMYMSIEVKGWFGISGLVINMQQCSLLDFKVLLQCCLSRVCLVLNRHWNSFNRLPWQSEDFFDNFMMSDICYVILTLSCFEMQRDVWNIECEKSCLKMSVLNLKLSLKNV